MGSWACQQAESEADLLCHCWFPLSTLVDVISCLMLLSWAYSRVLTEERGWVWTEIVAVRISQLVGTIAGGPNPLLLYDLRTLFLRLVRIVTSSILHVVVPPSTMPPRVFALFGVLARIGA